MTRSLVLMPGTQPEATFKEQTDELLARRWDELITMVKKWATYSAEMGATTLVLENCPVLTVADVQRVADWFEAEGFTVDRPRFLTRSTVVRLA